VIFSKGEPLTDLREILKDIKTKKIVHGMNGYMKIILPKDIKINMDTIKKLQEAGFVNVSKK